MDTPPIDPPDDTSQLPRERVYTARATRGRSRTLSVTMMERELRALEHAGLKENASLERPTTRGECERGIRPCPFVGCKYHLYLDVNAENGSLKLNFPEQEPDELTESCALDIADQGGITLEETGVHLNLTRERVRQVEERTLLKVRDAARVIDQDRRVLRRLPIVDPDTIELLDELDESA